MSVKNHTARTLLTKLLQFSQQLFSWQKQRCPPPKGITLSLHPQMWEAAPTAAGLWHVCLSGFLTWKQGDSASEQMGIRWPIQRQWERLFLFQVPVKVGKGELWRPSTWDINDLWWARLAAPRESSGMSSMLCVGQPENIPTPFHFSR